VATGRRREEEKRGRDDEGSNEGVLGRTGHNTAARKDKGKQE